MKTQATILLSISLMAAASSAFAGGGGGAAYTYSCRSNTLGHSVQVYDIMNQPVLPGRDASIDLPRQKRLSGQVVRNERRILTVRSVSDSGTPPVEVSVVFDESGANEQSMIVRDSTGTHQARDVRCLSF